jgi:hypothetical protein
MINGLHDRDRFTGKSGGETVTIMKAPQPPVGPPTGWAILGPLRPARDPCGFRIESSYMSKTG